MASTLLDEALEGWRYTREGVIAEFENFPADSLDFRPAPQMRSLSELAWHIVESGAMMAGELSRPDGNFRRQPYPEFLREYSRDFGRPTTKDELIALLRQSHEDGEARLKNAGELLMLQTIIQFNGVPATRLSWMSHGVAHEEYHRGQLAMCARLLGLVPALTQLIEG
ncbi:MAG TPA: DinB family protein [Vicinamibacterales bacterium]|nr:DinB family protein [Vicinamibacterales bacterium]